MPLIGFGLHWGWGVVFFGGGCFRAERRSGGCYRGYGAYVQLVPCDWMRWTIHDGTVRNRFVEAGLKAIYPEVIGTRLPVDLSLLPLRLVVADNCRY